MLALGDDGLIPFIKSIGLFHRSKAKAIIAMSRRLIEVHGGQVPSERQALEALPGVGRKTANVVLNTAFRPRPASPSTPTCSGWPIALAGARR